MRILTGCLVLLVVIAGCGREGPLDVGGEVDGGVRRPETQPSGPGLSAFYRVDGCADPDSPGYDPAGCADTALMGVPDLFVWRAEDPAGACDTVRARWRLDGGAFSRWSPDTTFVLDNLAGTSHVLDLVVGCPGVSGGIARYPFTVNFDPDSEILEPVEPSGTLTVSDGDTIWFRVTARDREELEGVGGGIAQISFGGMIFDCPPDTLVWWFSSRAAPGDPHYIESVNMPWGGNRPHQIRVLACDVHGRWETEGDSYLFRYNFPPETTILQPAEGATAGADFSVVWEGHDPDGEVLEYQYALDPATSAFATGDSSAVHYQSVDPGEHEFWVRARDNRDCWEVDYQIVTFYVE